MANPFLMMDEEVGSPGTNEVASNPFLMQDAPAEEFDNPFAAQGTNPFAAFGDEEEPAPVNATVPPTTVADIFMPAKPLLVSKANTFHPIDPAMSFFGTTIDHEDDEPIEAEIKHPQLSQFDDGAAYSSEEELTRKKGPPPRPTPPSQTTQELIFAVADQLDAASSHLLNRIPKTRTPSPVSMRDLHSPSPTPDSAMGDLLDVSDGSFQATGQGSDFDVDLMGGCGTDNPFAPTSIPPMQAPAPPQPAGKAQPPRPPPPRPAAPPRPSPPVTAPVPVQATPAQNIVQQQQQQPQPQEPDLFDIFGDSAPPSKPPAPKSKEDILSLFSKPVQPPPVQPDLLSGDILLDEIPESDVPLPPPLTEIISQPILPPPVEQPSFVQQQASEPLPVSTSPEAAAPIIEPAMPISQTSPESEPIAEPEPAIEPAPPQPIAQEQPTTTITEPDHAALTEEPEQEVDSTQAVMDSIIPEVTYKRAPTPDIEITTVESLPRSDDEEEPQPELEKDEVNVETDQSPTADSSVTAQAMPESPIEFASSEPFGEPEQMDTGLDFAPSIPSGAASANPFASPEEEVYPQVPVENNIFAAEDPLSTSTNIFAAEEPTAVSQATNIFAVDESQAANIFAVEEPNLVPQVANIFAAEPLSVSTSQSNIFELEGSHGSDEFDAFAAKFDSVKKDNVSLLDGFGGVTPTSTGDAWGDSDAFGGDSQTSVSGEGFGGDEGFDSFLALKAPESTKFSRKDSGDSPAEEKEFSVVIRPKYADASQGIAPVLAPPPPPRGSQNNSIYSGDSSPRINPFDKSDEVASADGFPSVPEPASMVRTDSQETPPTPLFDDDVSQPLEDFPRVTFTGTGWEMQLRQPNKKKITGQRFWKKIFMKLVFQGDNPVLQLFNQASDKEPFQELPLQPCYSVSEIGAQQYDQFGKIFTVKLQYIFYKERPGVRPGQVTKAERLTNKLSQFAAYAIQGDYQGVKEFGSDLKKLGLPVEHAPQVSQLFKIGSMSFEDLKQFSVCVEEALFKLPAHRDRALTYKSEEVQITAVDELYVEQDAEGHVEKQIARVRLFFLGFLSGMPSIELGVNDLWRQGKEVVGRHDIIPVVTEEWIRLEGVEFHNCVQQDEYERSRTIKFQPPDACYIELMRFRVRPPKNRELPLQLKATWCVTGNKVELRADILVPGFASRKLGQIPCEDVAVRFPIPECWIYLFRVEKHFRYGSVKSAHRRTGKIKGIERILGTVDTLQESLIEVTSGQAKYEHHHRAIVWRCPRLPKEGQGAYTTHQMVCRMALTSYDQIPEQLAPYCYVEFTMPATQVSHTTVRSVSVQESDSDEPPEKYVRYLARHEYRVGIESTTGESPNAYLAATRIKEEPVQQPAPPVPSPMAPSDTDSDSN